MWNEDRVKFLNSLDPGHSNLTIQITVSPLLPINWPSLHGAPIPDLVLDGWSADWTIEEDVRTHQSTDSSPATDQHLEIKDHPLDSQCSAWDWSWCGRAVHREPSSLVCNRYHLLLLYSYRISSSVLFLPYLAAVWISPRFLLACSTLGSYWHAPFASWSSCSTERATCNDCVFPVSINPYLCFTEIIPFGIEHSLRFWEIFRYTQNSPIHTIFINYLVNTANVH